MGASLPVLDYHKPETIKHFANIPRVEPTVIDHSSLKLFKDCQQRYFFRVVLGYKKKDTSVVLGWGSTLHKFWEILEKTYQVTSNAEGSFKTAVLSALEYWDKEVKPDPVGTKWDFMERGRLIFTMKACYDYFLAEKKAGKIKVIEIERSFCITLPSGMITSGRMDQIISWSGRLWVRDWKTTSKNAYMYTGSLEPNDQLTRYTYALTKLSNQAVQGSMIVAMYNTKNEGPVLRDHHTTRNAYQLNHWEAEQAAWVEMLQRARDNDSYPMNENICGWCDYKKICETPSEGGKISQLRSLYKFDPWNPLHHED